MISILYIGDVCGSVGRNILARELPRLRQKYQPDLVIVNAENSAGGYGVNAKTVNEITDAGADLCTGGDHTFTIPSFQTELNSGLNFIRAANYSPPGIPGKPYEVIDLGAKGRVGVIQLLGQELFAYSQKVNNPFLYLDEFHVKHPELQECDLVLLEIHAESTAEKLSLAWHARTKVQAVVGTHTHVATADNRLLGDHMGKVAYVTDIGQVGPYAASLWVKFDIAIHNFKYPFRRKHELEESKPQVLNSVLMKFERNTGQKYSPKSIDRVDVIIE